jgi:DNA-binding beta-propeller fold protein YncE
MKLKSLLIILIMVLFSTLQANATQLPKELKDFLQTQKKVPIVRNDGILVYGNDVMYLPVLPAYPEKVNELKIVKTFPLNKSMDSLPDMVLFNNNYALLKAYRVDSNTITVKNFYDLPPEIKTGSLPQDMIVPRGLVLPENLAGILGDVHIPLVGGARSSFVSSKRSAPLPSGKRIENAKYSIPAGIKNKLFFVNNFQTEYLEVYSSTVSEPLYSLKTTGVMKDVKPVLGGKYLLAATRGQKNLDVIDVEGEYVAKHIDLTANPSEIAIDNKNAKAYVASVEDESLFIIDLTTMTMKEKIQLVGAPQRLAISEDGTKIAYSDVKTSNIYILELENEYSNKLITNYPNTTKIILKNDVLYLIARTSPKLRIVSYDLMQDNKLSKTKKDKARSKQENSENKKQASENATNDIYNMFDTEEVIDEDETADNQLLQNMKTYSSGIVDVNIGEKPIDMYEYKNNLYVLCAGNNALYKYTPASNSIVEDKLPVGGFVKSLTPVPNSNLAVITNMSDLKYVVYDLDKSKSLQTLPISEYINTIIILERNNG